MDSYFCVYGNILTWLTKYVETKLNLHITKPTKWPVCPEKTQINLGSLISLCCVHEEALGPWLSLECKAKNLIRLGPGWSESSLGAQVILLVLLCYGSNGIIRMILFRTDSYNAAIIIARYQPRHAKMCLWAFSTGCDSNKPAQLQNLA